MVKGNYQLPPRALMELSILIYDGQTILNSLTMDLSMPESQALPQRNPTY